MAKSSQLSLPARSFGLDGPAATQWRERASCEAAKDPWLMVHAHPLGRAPRRQCFSLRFRGEGGLSCVLQDQRLVIER